MQIEKYIGIDLKHGAEQSKGNSTRELKVLRKTAGITKDSYCSNSYCISSTHVSFIIMKN